ncbi:MAG: acyl-CoA thioesterase, partial [Bdellovibrionales bacterium]|nr:acyl-CoA thioesterase [Bdellovibrionales bacterium]
LEKPVVFEHDVHVRHTDFDQYGHVAAMRYLDYVFTSRWLYSEKIGLGLESSIERGVIFPVIRSEVNYKREIVKAGPLFVRSWIEEIENAKFWVKFQIFSSAESDAILHSDGQFLCVCCDLKSRKPMKVPEWVIEKLGNA